MAAAAQLVRWEAAWPTVRGAGALAAAAAAALQQRHGPAAADNEIRVVPCPGHVIAIGRRGTAVVALDAVPATGWQIPEAAQAQLAQILSGTDPAEPVPVSDPLKPLLISTAPHRVVGVFYQQTMTMRKPPPPPAAAQTPGAASGGTAAGPPPPAAAVIIPGPDAVPGAPAVVQPVAPPLPVAAPPDPSKGPFVWIMRENGVLELWKLARRKYAWTMLLRARLPAAASGGGSGGSGSAGGERTTAVLDVAFLPITSNTGDTTLVLVYTEAAGPHQVNVWAQALLVEHVGPEQTTLQCSLPKPVLRGVAPVSLAVISGGVALLPRRGGGEPADTDGEDVCYFWSADNALSALWSSAAAAPSPAAGGTGSAPLLISQPTLLSLIWGRGGAMKERAPPTELAARLVAAAVHPVTRELLVLDTTGQVTVCAVVDGALQLRRLVALEGVANLAAEAGAVALAYHRLFLVLARPDGLW